jgi:transposase
MHQIHNNENAYCWQFKGKKNTKKVPSNSGRRRLNIIGAINPVDLEPTIVLTEANCNTELIIEYLKMLKTQYKNKDKICLILDNASYNRSYQTQEVAADLGIELMYLPPYSPNLNLIERLWKFFKKKIMKNKYYPNFKEFEKQVTTFFKDFDDYKDELKSLLTLNFGIIKAS